MVDQENNFFSFKSQFSRSGKLKASQPNFSGFWMEEEFLAVFSGFYQMVLGFLIAHNS